MQAGNIRFIFVWIVFVSVMEYLFVLNNWYILKRRLINVQLADFFAFSSNWNVTWNMQRCDLYCSTAGTTQTVFSFVVFPICYCSHCQNSLQSNILYPHQVFCSQLFSSHFQAFLAKYGNTLRSMVQRWTTKRRCYVLKWPGKTLLFLNKFGYFKEIELTYSNLELQLDVRADPLKGKLILKGWGDELESAHDKCSLQLREVTERSIQTVLQSSNGKIGDIISHRRVNRIFCGKNIMAEVSRFVLNFFDCYIYALVFDIWRSSITYLTLSSSCLWIMYTIYMQTFFSLKIYLFFRKLRLS